ncbi:hypothetical protein GE061_015965 [Apolygus lucorum]|uniref:Uncharacterized protein n=1 Tax=Apolygus lucorum TaxID=248454 RepID=A0A6A4JQV3_APOLU|nr:hypothetical protein GE061_015965 [Apolygus lucorum]
MDGQNFDEQNSAINISDVIEVIETTDPDFGMMDGSLRGLQEQAGAYVKILEQPASKALRFRYECEGRSAGSIPGVNSTPENKTFPTIQIVGYKGKAVVVVSCVTKDPPYRPHPHNLVGKDNCKKGVCTVEVNNENMIATFANLGIQCVKKKDIEEALKIREEIRVDPFRTKFTHKNQPSSIDLNAVRLCFQVFLEGPTPGKFTVPLQPITSEPIYDKKAMADLVICKLSHCSGSVIGGNEIILLCEKVAKEDISVRFFEEKDGIIVWEGYGDFTPTQVHKQVAISFRTPRYRTLEIDQPVQALIQLRRPSDNATSEALPFQITPLDSGRPFFWSLRRSIGQKADYNTFASILQSNSKNTTVPVKLEDANNNDKSEECEVVIEEPPAVTVADVPQPKVVLMSDDKEESQDIDNDLEELIVRDLLSEDSQLQPDVGTYTSLQMAMKNPCEFVDSNESYEDVLPPPPRPTACKPPVHLRSEPPSPTYSEDTAPPLPPKRAKKIESKPEKKLSLFQKLFSTNRRKKDKKLGRRDSLRSLPVGMIEIENNKINNDKMETEILPEMRDPEITEAEHYALYTSVAPHATASEFDEMSFYYSSVEGRKIN